MSLFFPRRRHCGLGFVAFLLAAPLAAASPAAAASGTLSGRLVDPAGHPVAGAIVDLRQPISGLHQQARSDAQGIFVIRNLPFDAYHLEAAAPGFRTLHQDVELHSSLPLNLALRMEAEGATVLVEAQHSLVEGEPGSHLDIDKSTIETSPAPVQSRAMESVLLTTPGFIQDENGRFHFRGSHGQVMYVVDGVPVTDQVQATFSNSLDPSQVESLSVVTGGVSAEYGGKPVAVVELTSKSGLGAPAGGDISFGLSRSSTYETGFSVRGGSDSFGYFLTGAASSSDRFLDPVNFDNLHNHGSTGRLFSRFDWTLGSEDTLRLSLSGGSTSRDVVNLSSQQAAGQAQTVRDTDANLGLSWLHLLGPDRSFEATLFTRSSTAALDPTQDLEDGFTAGGHPDFPFWARQARSLDNQGALAAYTQQDGGNLFKAGAQFVRYPIHENFAFAITDQGQAAPGDPLYAYTPAGGGHIFRFDDRITPTLASAFIQDDLSLGNWKLGAGLRYDRYDGGRGFAQGQLQPRLGAAYKFEASGTVLRASYDRLLITPENENLAFSTSQQVWTATTGLATPVPRLRAELQDSYLAGVEQQLGRIGRLSLDYWWKDSTNSADNSQFLNTGILFPIAAARGKFHGLDLRFDTVVLDGWSGYLSAGTVRTVFYDPTVGGLDAASSAQDTAPYLIDHDQKLTLQAGLRFAKAGFYGQLIDRYDSGLEAGDPTTVAGNPDYDFGIPFVRAEQDSLVGLNYRIKSRNILDLSLGQAFKVSGGAALLLGLDVLNLTDEKALYNFLSTFGGTHVVPPRTVALHLKFKF